MCLSGYLNGAHAVELKMQYVGKKKNVFKCLKFTRPLLYILSSEFTVIVRFCFIAYLLG